MRGKRRTIRVSSARPQHAIYLSIGGYRVVLDIHERQEEDYQG